MIPLKPSQYDGLTPLIPPLEHHLVLHSIIQGKTKANAFLDSLSDPTAGLVLRRGRAWLLGSPTASFINDISDELEERYYPYLKNHRADGFGLNHDGQWTSSVEALFNGLTRTEYHRSYLQLDTAGKDWEHNPPAGFRIVEVDEDLLSSGYANVERVREETTSERDSVEDFLEKSFGYAALKDTEIVAWCMSEYNAGERCELGIETVQKHQRKGLATLVAKAVIRRAANQGVKRVGWHCWRNNVPSVRTALRIGFTHDRDYVVTVIRIP